VHVTVVAFWRMVFSFKGNVGELLGGANLRWLE
jgi:hypothetical protein